MSFPPVSPKCVALFQTAVIGLCDLWCHLFNTLITVNLTTMRQVPQTAKLYFGVQEEIPPSLSHLSKLEKNWLVSCNM